MNNLQSICRGYFPRIETRNPRRIWLTADLMAAAMLGYTPEARQKPQDAPQRKMPHPVMGFKLRPSQGL
jgi:hypothetical protein